MPGFARIRVALAIAGTVLAVGGGTSQAARTGMILGQVVDANGSPVAEAIVQLTVPSLVQTPTSPRDRVMADGEGRFFFTELPPADYYLWVTKDGYLGGGYGQRRPSGQTRNITLAADERRTDIKVTIWKYGVISGAVVDEAGEPVVGIGVRAIERQWHGGRPIFGNLLDGGPTAVTDDRGRFRIPELRPGTYAIGVPVTQTTLPVVTLDAAVQDVDIRNDLFWGGVMEAAPLGSRGIQQVGDFAVLTLQRVLISPPPMAGGRRQVYRSTFFPDAARASAATPIVIRSGDERSDVAITLRPMASARVSGRLVTADGSTPPPIMLQLRGEAAADVSDALPSGSGAMIAMFTTANARSTVDGRFTFFDVPPGEYVLRQANRFLQRDVQMGREPYWLSQRITVGASDIDDLVVPLKPAFRVEGRFEIAGGSTPVPPILENGSITFETPFGEPGRFAGQSIRGKRAFAMVAGGARVIASPVETGGWFVQSIALDGKDITDRAFDLQSDASLVITYTDKPSKVSGVVKDARGSANADAAVLAFPVDPARWTGYGNRPRMLQRVLTLQGEYTIAHLPPGEYYVIAIDETESDDWQDPKRLEVLARQATRLSVAPYTPATLDLTIKDVR